MTAFGHVRVLGAEHARLDLERPLELKKGVFEVALLEVHNTNVTIGRGHVRGARSRTREFGSRAPFGAEEGRFRGRPSSSTPNQCYYRTWPPPGAQSRTLVFGSRAPFGAEEGRFRTHRVG